MRARAGQFETSFSIYLAAEKVVFRFDGRRWFKDVMICSEWITKVVV